VLTSALALAFTEIRQSLRLNLRVIAVYVAAILAVLTAAGFGLSAIHRWLSVWQGPMAADLILAGALLVLALVLWLVGRSMAKEAARKAQTARLIAAAPLAAQALFKGRKLGMIGLAAALVAGVLAGREFGKDG